ncbi:hypothetical protein FJY94_03335 [Candidatus Kaiserbacteria bacterium]|nr:hypothetical protein [Candidatus Kaiserbacteria bacterium]
MQRVAMTVVDVIGAAAILAIGVVQLIGVTILNILVLALSATFLVGIAWVPYLGIAWAFGVPQISFASAFFWTIIMLVLAEITLRIRGD